MASMPLTEADWKRLVKSYIVPAFGPQLDPAKFDPHADWVGKQVVSEKWTVSRTEWCLGQVTRFYRKLDNLFAMLNQVDVGQRDRDGNVNGGWIQSKVHQAENQAVQDIRDRNDCYAMHRDFPHKEPGCTQQKGYCAGCPGIPKRSSPRTGHGLKSVGDVAKDLVKP